MPTYMLSATKAGDQPRSTTIYGSEAAARDTAKWWAQNGWEVTATRDFKPWDWSRSEPSDAT